MADADDKLLDQPLKNFGIRKITIHYLYSFSIVDPSDILLKDYREVENLAKDILNSLENNEGYERIDLEDLKEKISDFAISQINIEKFVQDYCPTVFKRKHSNRDKDKIKSEGLNDHLHKLPDPEKEYTKYNIYIYLYPKLGICICEFIVNKDDKYTEKSFKDIIRDLYNERKELYKQAEEVVKNDILRYNKDNHIQQLVQQNRQREDIHVIDLFRITDIEGDKNINEFSSNEKRVLVGLINLSDRFPWYTEDTINNILSSR